MAQLCRAVASFVTGDLMHVGHRGAAPPSAGGPGRGACSLSVDEDGDFKGYSAKLDELADRSSLSRKEVGSVLEDQ